MKFNPIPLATLCLLTAFSLSAQVPKNAPGDENRYRLQLRNGSFIPQKNITADEVEAISRKNTPVNGKSLAVIQFENIPTAEQRKQLEQSGIILLDYIPNNAYTASVAGSLSATVLTRGGARALIQLKPEQKMQPELANGIFPSRSVKVPGTIDVWISYARTFLPGTISNELRSRNFDVISTLYQEYRVLGLRVPTNRLAELAALSFIEYVEAAPKEDELLNDKSIANDHANVLQSSLPGGWDLRGEGVTIGIGDDSNPLRHIDFNGRMINHAAIPGNAHGLHVMGTSAGAGIMNEKYKGHAPGARIVAQITSNILAYAPAYVADYDMVITNNSYGNVTNDCSAFGVYDLYSRIMDLQALRMPSLQHVFAAGNSGGFNCGTYPPGFRTVLGAYQSSKNSIMVGNSAETFVINGGSSKGPVRDGRIKPDITAQGARVISTVPINVYGSNTGTSMSAPAVAGGLALLYQRYRQLHSNANPENGLMKALLCNGATDIGNTGPDYTYGFGFMNLLRSVKMLEHNNYFYDSVDAGATKIHEITIPSGIAQLKVMLYWNDSAAAVLASQTLVNDLDLEVNGASGLRLPYKLDTLPANVNNAATTGADHINNMEQVVINNPVPGIYSFAVTGTTIPLAPRYEYFLVYDTLAVSATLTYPMGGERFKGGTMVNKLGDSIYISWDAAGNDANTFTLQFSADNGSSWSAISPVNIAGNLRQLKWFVPDTVTSQARIKLIHNGTGIESISDVFTILGVPAMTATQCQGYITLSWAAITGATDYEVMMLRGEDMVPVAVTTGITHTLKGLPADSVYYVAVRARLNTNPGRRSVAVSIQPNGATCGGTISDNDLKLDAILSPASSGRILTSTELSNNDSIRIRIRNLDNAATTGDITVAYKLGTDPEVIETITAPNIAAGATYSYTFAAHVNMAAVGIYNLRVRVEYPADTVNGNDTLFKTFKQLDNEFIDLSLTDFLDDIESATVQSHTTAQTGLDGLDRYDFVSTTAFGRIRTFVSSGIAYSGSKALTLDADRYNAAGTTDSLKATFNLQGYNVATDDIRFDFRYKHHGQGFHAANKVWIRGNDQQPWIEVYDLYANQETPGVFRKIPAIEISDVLVDNGQIFTSSFQVRWGQFGSILAADNQSAAGYTFDDIHFYTVQNDIQMISIDTPVVASCGLTNAVPVQITVRNSSNATIFDIPIVFQADANPVVEDTIPSIAANTTVTYTFTATADLSAPGSHTVSAWVDLASDTYHDNDTAVVILHNAPVVTSFPYLQNFETDNGDWHSDGTNNSWEYGTPASPKINRAASGSKAWKTTLAGNYNDGELSYLYSPCFDISGMTYPRLSFSVALDLEDCGAVLCDAAYMEYSADGITWSKLGNMTTGTNWYNRSYAGHQVWSIQNYARWHVATTALPPGLDRLRLRFVVASDPYVSFEGIAVDDIHIYDSVYGIYNGPPYTSAAVNQPAVNGTGWVDFVTGNKLIASINPNGQNLGSTAAQTFIHTGPVRVNTLQYYHNRNITIKPANVNLADSATVRFYFLDVETEFLVNATGCTPCSRPASAYELGVTKYSDGNDAVENGSLTDNNAGSWLFIDAANVVKVPFDKGYYAEFKVRNFSEFWLNNGGPGGNQVLPVELISFTAKKKQDNDVLVEWVTASEYNVARYEVELAKGNEEYRQNHFIKIGEVLSNGTAATDQHYQLTDEEGHKSGVRYYRLKSIDQDGRFSYSLVRPVVFDEEIKWDVYPNPSTGKFNLVLQANAGETVDMKIYDVNGKQVQQARWVANGFVQKTAINLEQSRFASGLYMLEVRVGGKTRVFKLNRQ